MLVHRYIALLKVSNDNESLQKRIVKNTIVRNCIFFYYEMIKMLT